MKETLIKIAALLITIVGFTAHALTAQQMNKTERKIDRIFQKTLKDKLVYNGFLRIDAPGKVNRTWWSGKFDDGTPVQEQTPFFTASLGKTFTASTIALLVSEGKLSFNDPVSAHLSHELLEGLHIYNGCDYSYKLTVSQLLQHRSGLPDYFEDQPVQGSNMFELIFREPDKRWEPEELLRFTRENFQARFEPGTGYHYTDTEYLLLGLIIEAIEKKPLGQVFTERIFKPLGMQHTCMHLRSEPLASSPTPMAELYAGHQEISTFRSLSADWAGGGLQSTTGDLMIFMKALFKGGFIDSAILGQMQGWTPESKYTAYGYGLRKWNLRKIFPLMPRLTMIGHSGSTGSFMYYCPELDTFITGTFNQTEFQKEHIGFLIKVLLEIKYS